VRSDSASPLRALPLSAARPGLSTDAYTGPNDLDWLGTAVDRDLTAGRLSSRAA